MTFDNPAFLWMLLLFAALIPATVIRYRGSREKAALFAAAAPSGKRKSLLGELRLRIILSDVLFLFFFAFLVVAVAGPRWGMRIVSDYSRGVDLIFAFDLSRSMNVRDCPPVENSRDSNISRLERGREIAAELAVILGDTRIGTAIGKGRGVVAVPLTYDSETVLNFLSAIDTQAVSGGGTNLESLVNTALEAFRDSVPSRREVILFSDGEFLSGSFQRALENARKAGITVSAVGLGSDHGGAVPVEIGPDSPDGFLLGDNRKAVVSSRQGTILKAGAEKTGGVYVDGGDDDAARVLAGHINSLSAESRLSGFRREANPRWRVFVIAAMLCLALIRIMGFSLRKDGRKSGKSGKFIQALLCLALFSSCEKTQGKLLVMEANYYNARGFYTQAISSYLEALNYEDAVPYAEYGLASAFFALEESMVALERYAEAEKHLNLKKEDHPELRYRIHYNMGIIHFERGEHDEAAAAFREALKIDGSRIEAKRNLELSLLTITRNNPPPASFSQNTTEDGERDFAGSAVLFDYLKQKEQDQWKSREWTLEDENTGPDY